MGSEFSFPQKGIYTQHKPPKIDRTITCTDTGTFHVSISTAPQHSEEISSDTRKKKGLGGKIRALSRNFTTGFKNRPKHNQIPLDQQRKSFIFYN